MAHHILDVELLAGKGVKFGDVAFRSQLFLVKFLAAMAVHKVALVGKYHPAEFVDSAPFFVNEKAFVGDHHAWLAINVVKVSHKVVGVEVVLLNTEGSGDFSALIKILIQEHVFVCEILNQGPGLRVNKVTTPVGGVALSVFGVAFVVLEHNHEALLVTVEVTEDVVLVEQT